MPESAYNVSVIMPTYNAASYLLEVLKSIDSQTTRIRELVISDDESEDETIEIISIYSQTAKYPIKVVSHKRNGVTANYLNALKQVTGDIILIADQDDVWLPTKVSMVLAAFDDQDVSIVCHDCLLVDERLDSLGKTLRANLSRSTKIANRINQASDEDNLRYYLQGGLPLLAHSLSIRASLIPQLLNKPESIKDWWFEEWVSFIALSFGRLCLLPEHLVLYRQHQKQTSGGFAQPSLRPDTTKFHTNKYTGRMLKINHCLALIQQHGYAEGKTNLLKLYGDYLSLRQNATNSNNTISALTVIIKIFCRGEYHRYSKGAFSFGLDIVSILNQSFRRSKKI